MHPLLAHLPQSKQNELTEIVKIIREIAEPAKTILFRFLLDKRTLARFGGHTFKRPYQAFSAFDGLSHPSLMTRSLRLNLVWGF